MPSITNNNIVCSFSISSKDANGNFTISASFSNTGSQGSYAVDNVRLSCSLTNGAPWTQINVGRVEVGQTKSGSTTISSGNTSAQNVYCYLVLGNYTSGTGGAYNVGAYVPPTPPTPTYAHSITYNANGGENAPPTYSFSTTTQNSFTARLSEQMPTRENYIFVGWATSATSKIAEYYPNTQYTFNSQSIALYAVWKSKSNIKLYYQEQEVSLYLGDTPMELDLGNREE